jgi:uncharacterized protein YciI
VDSDTPAPAASARPSVHERYAETGYVALCWDAPGSAAARDSNTPAHLRYVERIFDEINLAGPLWDPPGAKIVGSFWCLRTKSEARARELLDGDPYVQAGCYARIDLFPFLPAAGRYIGGKVW